MVVSLHLEIKHLALIRVGVGDQLVLNDFQNVRANIFQLSLNLALVGLDKWQLVHVALLLDGGNHSPAGAARSNDVLVGNGQKVSLFNAQLLRLLGNSLHVIDHFIKSAKKERAGGR